MTSTSPMLSYVAPALALIAVACWLVCVYSIIRLWFALRRLRRSTGLRWSPHPGAAPSLSALINSLGSLPPNCQVHLRRAYISGGLFACLVLIAMVTASIAGPLVLRR